MLQTTQCLPTAYAGSTCPLLTAQAAQILSAKRLFIQYAYYSQSNFPIIHQILLAYQLNPKPSNPCCSLLSKQTSPSPRMCVSEPLTAPLAFLETCRAGPRGPSLLKQPCPKLCSHFFLTLLIPVMKKTVLLMETSSKALLL